MKGKRTPEPVGYLPLVGGTDQSVIPALIAYVKVVAVKTLVVGFRSSEP